MSSAHADANGPATDRRRIALWENEGGHLGCPDEIVVAGSDSAPHDDATTRWMRAAPLSDVPDEEAIHLELEGMSICLARSEGTVHALLDECSHGQVALSDGEVGAGVIECWLHGSCFDLASGVPTGPPAILPVPVYPCRIVAGIVEVGIPRPDR